MSFKGTEGKKISLQKARTMIGGHQKSKAFKVASKSSGVKGGFYGKKTLLKILSQPNCVGVRYFHARNASKQPTIVLVGEHKDGSLLTKMMVNEGPICPPICDKSMELGL
jgi:hypothetical protein